MRGLGQSGWHELSGVGDRLRSFGASAGAELAAELAAAEAALHDTLAAALQVPWPVSRWPIYVFTAGAMVCLLTSATCHLFGCCAEHIAARLWRADYAGIAVLIVASFFPPVYYGGWVGGCFGGGAAAMLRARHRCRLDAGRRCAAGPSPAPPRPAGFLCAPWTRLFYLVTSSLLGASTLCVTLLDCFQRAEWQARRALLFVALGLWGIVPMLHSWATNSGVAAVAYAFCLDLLMGAIYIVRGLGQSGTRGPTCGWFWL